MVAAPAHGHLIEVFKEGDEPQEVGVLQKLLLDVIDWDLDILEVVPLEQPCFSLSQGFLKFVFNLFSLTELACCSPESREN